MLTVNGDDHFYSQFHQSGKEKFQVFQRMAGSVQRVRGPTDARTRQGSEARCSAEAV